MQKHLPNSDFTLHYWDWTTDKDRSFLFDSDRLGSHDNESGVVSGALMSDWYLVCTDETGEKVTEVCDPTKTLGNYPVIRCQSTAHCDSPHWPDEENVKKVSITTTLQSIGLPQMVQISQTSMIQ